MKFGEYEIVDRIAVGGMAEIYRGRAVGEEGFEKPVAIKRILPPYAADARFVDMLLKEARIHASLSHRNIVQIHDLGVSEDGEYFIVLEYVDGRDLGSLLYALHRTPSPSGGKLRLSDAVALYAMIELAEGVHFAHELRGPDGQPLGLVHRDISPSNVLLSYAGEVKLSDFGLAKRRTDHSVVGSLKGKLAYMSPEQARRIPLDRRTDIFSIGAVLFELLTGRRLREIGDDGEGWRQVASGLVPSHRDLRPDLPQAIEGLLSGALAPDPRDRFPDARAFVAAAREALEGVPRAPAGEATELQGLLATLLPPGSPRLASEPSRVIRLFSELARAQPAVRAPTPPLRRRTPTAPAPTAATPGATRSATPPPPRVTPLAMPLRLTTPSNIVPSASAGPARTPASGRSSPRPLVTQRPPARRQIRLGRAVLVAALLVPAAAAVIHVALVPLPILHAWGRPTRLDVSSHPSGADVYLDGHRLSAQTPTYTEVSRDRQVHAVELRKEGFQPVKRSLRFDRNEILTVSVSLIPEKRPSFQAMPGARQRSPGPPPAPAAPARR